DNPSAVEERAVVLGRGNDGTTGRGLAGAVVQVIGAPEVAITDSAGDFPPAAVASGAQYVLVPPPKLRFLRGSTRRTAPASRGDSVRVDFAVPAIGAFARNLCRASGSGVLGLVLGPEGKPAPGIEVWATWPDQNKHSTTSARGLFALCNLPAGQTMEVRFSN